VYIAIICISPSDVLSLVDSLSDTFSGATSCKADSPLLAVA